MKKGDSAQTAQDRKRHKSAFLAALPSMAPHPTRTRSRAVLYGSIGAAPAAVLLAGFLLVLIWSFAEPESGLKLLLGIANVLRMLIPLLAFMGGFGAAGVLILMASKAGIRFASGDAPEGGRGILAALVATASFGLIGVGLSIWSGNGQLEILGLLLLVMPFVLSVAILGAAVDRREGRSSARVFGLIPLVAFVLLYASVVMGALTRSCRRGVEWLFGADLIQQYAAVHPALDRLDDLVRSASMVLLFAAIGIWCLMRKPWGKDQDEDSSESKSEDPPGLITRIWRAVCAFVRRLFGGQEEEEEEKETPGTPAFLDELLGSEDPPGWLGGTSSSPEPGRFFRRDREAVPRAEGTPFWRGLFGGKVPTVDQVRVLETLLGRREDLQVDENRPGVMPDMLLEGEFASGRTTALAAAAIASVVLRGQYTMILVPNRSADARIRELIAELLAWARLDGLIETTTLEGREELVSGSSKATDLPQILVGTISDVQHVFFEGRLANDGIRDLLAAIGVILVDDLLEFSDEHRRELPFVMQKIRMLQSSLRTWGQFVVVIPMLDRMATVRDHLARRLFSQVHPYESVRLRNWRALPGNVRVIPVDSVDRMSALAEIAGTVDPDWGRVVFVSAAESEEFESSAGARVEVVRKLSDLPTLAEKDRKEWVILIEDGHRSSRQLAARIDLSELGSKSVWVSLVSPGDSRDASDLQFVPLQVPTLGSSAAQGRWIRHAMEVIPHLAPMSPIDRTEWIQFGLPGVGEIQRVSSLDVIVPVFSLELDPPDAMGSISGAAMSGRRSMYHWVSVNQGAMKNASMLDPDREYRVALRAGNEVVVVGGEEPSEGRHGYWLSETGQAIGSSNQIDFAVADRLVHRHGSVEYAPSTMRIDQSGRVRVTAAAIGDDDRERAFCYPIWSGSWFLPRQEIGTEIIIVPRGVSGAGMRRLDLDDAGHVRRHVLRDLTWRASGLANGSGISMSLDLKPFRFTAGLSLLLVGSGLDQMQNEDLVFADQIAGGWGIGAGTADREYWPELTAALNHGLRAVAPGVEHLGRILVFRKGPVAQIALLEPWSSLGSLPELVDLVLRTETLRRRLGRKAQSVLSSLEGAGPVAAEYNGRLVRAAGFGVEGTLTGRPLALRDARAIVERIVD